MEIDPHVVRLYERFPEHERLWEAGKGELTRLRTWDLFERHLPPSGRVLDVGGGPGVHASHLTGLGYDVTLIDPMLAHLAQARARAADDGHPFATRLGTASDLGEEDASADAVLLMGPLYHLIDPDDRIDALAEARRVLRPGGRLFAEVITRHAWTIDGTLQHVVGRPGELDHMASIAATGFSDPTIDGGFWAYFHHPAELRDEVDAAGFVDVSLLAVEGFAWLLADLAERMIDPDALLAAVRLTETDESMLGVSTHVMAVATVPEPVVPGRRLASASRHPSSGTGLDPAVRHHSTVTVARALDEDRGD